MENFGTINQFGSLTINGKTLKFEDFDKDKNGEISSQEYQSLLKEVKLDTVEFSSVDTDKDEILTTEEFAAWEQKINMQEAVNNMGGRISKDFTGKTQYLSEVKNALKEYIEVFATAYTGDISKMAMSFEATLPTKYLEIKANVLSNDSSTIKSDVLDLTYSQLINEGFDSTTLKRFGLELEKEADNFIRTYNGNNLRADLKTHLQAFLNKSDATTMADAAAKFKNGTQGLGPMYDSNDLAIIKDYARDLLTTAVENGVIIKLGDTNIKTTANITAALNKYTDGEELLKAVNDAINSLSELPKKEAIVEEEKTKAKVAAEKAFTDIKGSEYSVNSAEIDFSLVDPRYFNGGEIYQRGKGWIGSKDKAFDEGLNLLTSDGLKQQIKSQIENMLKAKGIPFDKIAQVFENVYNQTAIETLNAEGMINGRGSRGASSKGRAYIDVKTLCDTFVANFNTNITKIIDEMNASNTDMDLQDINIADLATDENGNVDEELKTLLLNGGEIKCAHKKEGEAIIEKLRSVMRSKAEIMCIANGIEFDEKAFNTIFNNSKGLAVGNQFNVDEENSLPWFLKNANFSDMNPQGMVNEFTATFKQNYTLWVEKEKNETKNA